MRPTITGLLALASITAAVTGVYAADRALELPQGGVQWLNSQPLSLEQFRGKAVVLYFFEEECPRCERSWPERMATAQKYAGRPVFFIAVNSATARGELDAYARRNKVSWPIVLDFDRSLEQRVGIPEISLDNIMQMIVVHPDGHTSTGDWSDFDATIESALKGAAWKVEPDTLPESLRSAWLAVELGNYRAAATSLKKSLNSRNVELRTAAESLQAVVQQEIDDSVAAAAEALEAGDKWTAYQGFVAASERFKGFDLPESVAEQKSALGSDPDVQAEQTALRLLERALTQLNGSNASARKRGLTSLKQIAEQHPDRAAGRRAQDLLNSLAPEDVAN